MTEKPRVRFAPSPTGRLHIGNARTALYNWLFARHCGGTVILRIEDTDRERTADHFERDILEGLQWLAIDWDEGPGRGGDYGPYRQCERLDMYDACLKELIAAGKVYPCYCSDEELEHERQAQILRKEPPRYSGRCRTLSREAAQRYERAGVKPAWRYRVEEGEVGFLDLIKGSMQFSADAIGDFIIVRSNGIPAYNFAAVIDDHLMEVSHVIRGEDHLSNTALQILLYQALGFDPPQFAHHSLILGTDRTKLSKRHGTVSVSDFRDAGILSAALANYLSLLGGSAARGKEVISREDMIGHFSLEKTGRGGAIFDHKKLLWLNGNYIRGYDTEGLTELSIPFITRAGYDCASVDRSWLSRVVAAVQGNIKTLADIGEYMGIFFDDDFELSGEARAVIERTGAVEVIESLSRALKSGLTDYNDIMERIRSETGMTGRSLFMPLRVALTGMTSGPELDRLFALLGTKSLIERTDNILKTLTDGSPVSPDRKTT